jgi:pimeloyl-ACP methyl ester carboxylesterase
MQRPTPAVTRIPEPFPGRAQRIDANGITFAYLELGEGPLVLLLHGFPDTAITWDHLMPELAAAGFRAVAPWLRGYAPSGISEGDSDFETQGRDVLALIEALGEESAAVIGHDWGASAAYMAAALDPARVHDLITVAIPHPATLLPLPGALWRARHFLGLRLPRAVKRLARDDFALVDALVKRWSPTWDVPPGETDAVKDSFSIPGSADAALGYYRALTPFLPAALRKPVEVPAITIGGLDDGIVRRRDFERARSAFAAGYELVMIPDAGHWVHREQPDAFNQAVLTRLRARL